MRLCNVVDTSIQEDRRYLEFWYADVVYAIRTTDPMYKVQKVSFEDWLYENTRYDCVYVPKPTEEDQL